MPTPDPAASGGHANPSGALARERAEGGAGSGPSARAARERPEGAHRDPSDRAARERSEAGADRRHSDPLERAGTGSDRFMPAVIERAAAAAWPSAVAEERDGWLLRATPGVPHRRNNSALPLVAQPDPAVVEDFYGRHRADPVVAVAPAAGLDALDRTLAAAGWGAEGRTDVLVADATALAGRDAGAVVPVDPLAWPNDVIREEVIARSGGEVHAFAEEQLGAVLCIRTGELAGVFRLHVAPAARRRGGASRLLAACAAVAPVLYAQVEADNEPAQRLFGGAGFTRSHGYHYRRSARQR
jgi:ribosomal protein S18 acetylase RimI-like enzyme